MDRVTQIDAGYAHTLLLTEKGDVWTFGCGLFGQMANGDNKKVGFLVFAFEFKSGIMFFFFLFKDYKACHSQRVTQPGETDISGILPQCGDRRRGKRVHVGLQSAGATVGGAAEEEGTVANHQEGDGKTAAATRGGILVVHRI